MNSIDGIFAVVCEAAADFVTASSLAERTLSEVVGWLGDVLPHSSLWFEFSAEDRFLVWKNVSSLARQWGVRVHGHFEGEPGAPDASTARKALILLKLLVPNLRGALLVRDDDRETQRLRGLNQARESTSLNIPIVIGLAHCKRESWVLAGWEPLAEDEDELLQGVRQALGFDPRTHAHQLTAKGDDDKRSAKRVLNLLTRNNLERESRCWTETLLSTLKERGTRSGLTDFLEEVTTKLVDPVRSKR